MLSIVKSMALNGLNGYLVKVETDITKGLPSFDVVGLPDTSVREAKERIRAAIKNSKIEFPSRKILINLAPASTKKEGTSLDLPMAIGILLATEQINTIIDVSQIAFIGELSLNGEINKVNGILPMCIDALKLGIKKVVIPKENRKEAAIVQGLDVIPVENLSDVIFFLEGNKIIKNYKVNLNKLLKDSNKYDVDFSEVKGQENIKRALEIAAAGRTQLSYGGQSRKWKNNGCKKITNYIA